jgi:5-methylcytosine-specific restriction endonuclease McrA
LNGYQKGKCFYCFSDISVADDDSCADVDHFFPHVLKQAQYPFPVDRVWNLVLSCRDCNRGVRGKSARVPAIRLLERLHKRNEFLIGESGH